MMKAYCARGFEFPSECDSSLCRERGCHAPQLVLKGGRQKMVVMKIVTMNVRTKEGAMDMMLLHDDLWLKSYDVDAHDGQGEIVCTGKQTKALRFASAAEALHAWRTQSTVKPLRADGKPNRPLSGYTVEIEPVEDD